MTVLQQTIRPSAQSREWKAIVILILLIPVLWSPPFLFRYFLYQPFNIPSNSMAPTLMVGDYVFSAKYAYGYGRYSFPFASSWVSGRVFAAAPDYGDIVVFRTAKDSAADYVKRVVGLPGDRIQMRQGQLFINDRPAELKPDGVGAAEDDRGGSEPAYRYVETLPNGVSHLIFKMRENGPLDNTPEVTVPAGHLFVLGDNRDNSADSRVPLRAGGVGLLPIDNLIGRADAVLGSWDLGMRGQPVWTWLSGFRLTRFFTAVH